MKLFLIWLFLLKSTISFANCDSKLSDKDLLNEVISLKNKLDEKNPQQILNLISCDTEIAKRLNDIWKPLNSSIGDCNQFPKKGPLFDYQGKHAAVIYCGGQSISGICICELQNKYYFDMLKKTEKGQVVLLEYSKPLKDIFDYAKLTENDCIEDPEGEISTLEHAPEKIKSVWCDFDKPEARKKIKPIIDQFIDELIKMSDAEFKKKYNIALKGYGKEFPCKQMDGFNSKQFVKKIAEETKKGLATCLLPTK